MLILRKLQDFRSTVAENSVLLGCDAASLGNLIPTFHSSLMSSSSKVEMLKKTLDISTHEDEDTTLPRNVGIRLPADAASYP